MSRLLKFALILPLILILAYAGLWFGGRHVASKYIEEFKGKEMQLAGNFMGSGAYKIKFENFEISGFPFTVNLRLKGVKEIRNFGAGKFNHPLEVKYNMLTGGLHASYSGDIDIKYDDITNLPNEKMTIADYKIYTPVPSVFTIGKLAMQNRIFEVVNHLKSLKLDVKRIDIANAKKPEQKIYQHDSSVLDVKIKGTKWYTSIDDLKANSVDMIDLSFKTGSSLLRKNPVSQALQIPAIFSLHTMQVKKVDTALKFKPTKKLMENITSDFELNITNFKFDAPLIALKTSGKIKSKKLSSGISYNIDLEKTFKLKTGYFANQYNKMLSKIDNSPNYKQNPNLQKRHKRSISRLSSMGFDKIENVELQADINSSITRKKNHDLIKIAKLSVDGAGAGINMSGETKVSLNDSKFSSKGDVVVKNYKKLLDQMMVSQHFKQKIPTQKMPKKTQSIKIPGLNLGGIKIPGLGKQIKAVEDIMRAAVYAGAEGIANKKSERPGDIAFDYYIDLDNISDGRIGNWSLGKFLKKVSLNGIPANK